MLKTKAIFCSLSPTCCLLFVVAGMAMAMLSKPAYAGRVITTGTAQNIIITADNNGKYNYGQSNQIGPIITQKLAGVKIKNDTHDVYVNAHGVCRYIDVGTVAGGAGLLVPFGTPKEWIGSPANGFLGTQANRKGFVKLDFCRAITQLSVDYADNSHGVGVSDPSSLVDVVPDGQYWMTPVTGSLTKYLAVFLEKRIETRYDDVKFADSLTEISPKTFDLSRKDCLGPTTYPDGVVRNPCFTWTWIETIQATFTDSISSNGIGLDRNGASTAASGLPIANPSESWTYSLARTACTGPNKASNETPPRPVPDNSCPPAIQPPVLGACPPAAHNTKQTKIYSFNNTRTLHTCGAGTVETAAGSYTYDLQGEFWCFDGTVYPPKPGTETEVNGRTVPSMCASVINGQVGPADGKSFNTQAEVTAAGLCNAGTVDAYVSTATGWSWTCKGSNGGSDAYGSANQHQAYNLACSTADSSLYGLLPAQHAAYSCDKFNTSGSTCAVTPTLTGLQGCCVAGQPNTASFNVKGFIVNGCDAAPTVCPAGTHSQCGVSQSLYAVYDTTASCTCATDCPSGTTESWTPTGPGPAGQNLEQQCTPTGPTSCTLTQGSADYNQAMTMAGDCLDGTPVRSIIDNGGGSYTFCKFVSSTTSCSAGQVSPVSDPACGAPACPTTPAPTYSWHAGDWVNGTCPAAPQPTACNDQCGQARSEGEQWCSYGGSSSSPLTCQNGNVVGVSSINGQSCSGVINCP